MIKHASIELVEEILLESIFNQSKQIAESQGPKNLKNFSHSSVYKSNDHKVN